MPNPVRDMEIQASLRALVKLCQAVAKAGDYDPHHPHHAHDTGNDPLNRLLLDLAAETEFIATEVLGRKG